MQKRLILIAGYAGNGKAFIAKQLLQHLSGYAFLHKDTLGTVFVEAMLTLLPHTTLDKAQTSSGPFDRESAAYLHYVRPLEYKALISVALENLTLGVNSIVVAPFLKELQNQQWLDQLTTQVRVLNGTLKIIWIQADADTTYARLQQRGQPRDIWKLTHWQHYCTNIAAIPYILSPHHIVDNSSSPTTPLQEQLQQALQFILE